MCLVAKHTSTVLETPESGGCRASVPTGVLEMTTSLSLLLSEPVLPLTK